MIQAQRVNNTLMLAPQAVSNGATVTANLDTANLGALTNAKALQLELDIAFASQVNTNALSPTVQVLESDDTVVTNFATITANSAPVLTAAGILAYYIDMRPRKRYIRVSVGIPTATNDNQVISVVAKTRAAQEPASTSDLATTAVIVN